jgi:NTE family protein
MPTLRKWLLQDPFTLAMSAGFFSFFAHCGLLSVLEEENLRPSKIAGSSAGALVGACWAAGCSTGHLKEILFNLSKKNFWDPAPGLGLLKGRRFRRLIAEISPVSKIEECRIPVCISAFDLYSYSTHILESGAFPESVYASCALPFLFQPIRLNRGLYFDGGIKDRPGLAGVSNGTRVLYHHISSRSPWRRKNSTALRIPKRENMVSVIINRLERVGPNRLEKGKIAFHQARQGMKIALEKDLRDSTRIYVNEPGIST